MLFHRFPAWNLAHALYFDQRMGAADSPFIRHRFKEGFDEGWISPAHQRQALEMFVLAEEPLLPPDLDIDPRPIDGHLHWIGHVAPDLNVRPMGRYQVDELRALKNLIISNLAVRNITVSSASFDEITTDLEEIPERVRWFAGDRMLHEVELEFTMASISLELTRRGIPTYSQILPDIIGSEAKAGNTEPADLAIVKLYFENQIEVPSPATFSEALNLRENPRIEAWRGKVRSWSDELQAGKIDFGHIKTAIDDANGYLKGASLPSRLLPHWSWICTLPMGFVEVFVAREELAHHIGAGLLAIESLHLLGKALNHAVRSPDPLQYKWFLVSSRD
ncbi:hypothetical protein ACQZ6F_25665 [Rhizobium sp. A22-96]